MFLQQVADLKKLGIDPSREIGCEKVKIIMIQMATVLRSLKL
jgi:hypothetical protein